MRSLLRAFEEKVFVGLHVLTVSVLSKYTIGLQSNIESHV